MKNRPRAIGNKSPAALIKSILSRIKDVPGGWRWLGGRKQGRRELAGGEGIQGAQASSKFGGRDGAPSAHLSEDGDIEL